MNVYLNDLSCGDPDISLVDNFECVSTFQCLLKALGKYGIRQVITDKQPKRLRLCDIRLGEAVKDKKYFDKYNFILSLINHFIFKDDLDASKEFLYNGRNSVLLAHARDNDHCAVSFVFTPEFEVDEIVETRDKNPGKIVNFYSVYQKTLVPTRVVTATECRKYNPLENPLWNKDASLAYHSSIEDRLAMIGADPRQKIAILGCVSETIAELNGWVKDENLSKINSNNGMVRSVYRSSDKYRKISYLSVDFEKMDVYFELFDKRGNHKGEYKWDGELSDNPDSKTHKLKLKR